MRTLNRSAKATTETVVVSALGVAARLTDIHAHLADMPQSEPIGHEEATALALLGRDLVTAGNRLAALGGEG